MPSCCLLLPRHNYLINQRIHSLLRNQHTLGHSITTPSEDDTINDWAEMVSISRTFIDYHQIPRGSRKRVESEVMILLRSYYIKVENNFAITVKSCFPLPTYIGDHPLTRPAETKRRQNHNMFSCQPSPAWRRHMTSNQ